MHGGRNPLALVSLENDHWQAGVLPATGASLAYGRAWNGSSCVDILRPTAEADYDNPSNCSSFIMLPWCNRIGGGLLTFDGMTHQLATSPVDGTARHGDVRNRTFTILESTPTLLRLTLDSRMQTGVNWPWAFVADVVYRLDGAAFIWEITLKNVDTSSFPAGFGHHPYFVRPSQTPLLQVPCDHQFTLVNNLAVRSPIPITPRLDFRALRPLPDETVDDVLTGRTSSAPVRLMFPDRAMSVAFHADPIFAHWVVYALPERDSFAVEPMTNVNDGFALYMHGVSGTGVFVLEAGQSARGTVSLVAQPIGESVTRR